VRSVHASKARRSDKQRVLSQSRRMYLTCAPQRQYTGADCVHCQPFTELAVKEGQSERQVRDGPTYFAHVVGGMHKL
jgi:hypothetical protein